MLLYHSTDEDGKAGIERDGFTVSYATDYPDCTFFQPSQDKQVTAWRRDWWVIVDIPDEIVRAHQIVYGDGMVDPYNIPIPWDIANQYPRIYERWED